MPKDFLGKPIETGDTIVYPGRQGSGMWLNKATVISIPKPKTTPSGRVEYKIKVLRTDGRYTHITELKRVVVVEKHSA